MLKLSLPGVPDFDLDDPNSGIVVNQWDPGYPEIRQVVENEVDRDGTLDLTNYFGARVVSIQAQLIGSPTSRDQTMERLKTFMAVGTRPTLTWQDTSDPNSVPRQTTLRADSFSAPFFIAISPGGGNSGGPGRAKVTASWRCPDPRWYSTIVQSDNIAIGGGGSSGRTYTRTYNRTYPSVGGGTGLLTLTNGGNLPSAPVIRFYSTCTNPSLTKTLTGETIRLLTPIASPNFIEVDMQAHTVVQNGDPNAGRYNLLDFVNSTWWSLDPGDNPMRFVADTVSGYAMCEVLWQDASL